MALMTLNLGYIERNSCFSTRMLNIKRTPMLENRHMRKSTMIWEWRKKSNTPIMNI